jgi:outer membrane protein assembly factor BamE (lipoprotein component of BamABCDE complex)
VIIQKEVFDKVELGMTQQEVKEILGEPDKIKLSVHSEPCYYYYIRKSVLASDMGFVKFDTTGKVSFSLYKIPD